MRAMEPRYEREQRQLPGLLMAAAIFVSGIIALLLYLRERTQWLSALICKQQPPVMPLVLAQAVPGSPLQFPLGFPTGLPRMTLVQASSNEMPGSPGE